MLYWIIPYLVAYNSYDFENWEYGPEYVFKVNVYDVEINQETDSHTVRNISMDLLCRPMSQNFFQCRIDSSIMDVRAAVPGLGLSEVTSSFVKLDFDDIVFQVDYNRNGISSISILNNDEIHIQNMIVAILDGMSMGISIVDKEVGSYVSQGEPINNICITHYNIDNELLSDNETKIQYKLLFGNQEDVQSIVVKKKRDLNECTKTTPYFITPYIQLNTSTSPRVNEFIMISQAQFNLGRNSFSSWTHNSGKFVIESDERIENSINETIHIKLRSIRPAQDEHWNIGNLGMKQPSGPINSAEAHRMFHWIIPYLVAFDANKTVDWKYGPQYVFDAAVRGVETSDDDNARANWDISMLFTCRPMHISSMLCRIESWTLDMFVTSLTGFSRERLHHHNELRLTHIIFKIDYDDRGISSITFMNNNQLQIRKIIGTIMDGINVGVNIGHKPAGYYVSEEKSTVGTFNTSFIIDHNPLSHGEMRVFEDFYFSLGPLGNSGPVIITKTRQLKKGMKKTPHFITTYKDYDARVGLELEEFVSISQSRFELGRNSFSSFIKNSGSYRTINSFTSDHELKTKVTETIDIYLLFIEPAPAEKWNSEHVVNATVAC